MHSMLRVCTYFALTTVFALGCSLPEGSEERADESDRSPIYTFDVTPGGDVRVRSNRRGEIRVEQNDGPAIDLKCPAGVLRASTCAISNDAEIILTGHCDGSLLLWQRSAESYQSRLLEKRKEGITSCRLAYDGRFAWVADRSGLVRRWDFETLTPRDLFRHPNHLKSMDLSSNGHFLATTGGGTYLWDAETGRRLRTIHTPATRSAAIAFSPAGDRIAIGTEGQGMSVYRIDPQNPESTPQRLWGHKTYHMVRQARFSPDGRFVAVTIVPKGSIEIRRADNGRLVDELDTHRGTIPVLRFVSSGDLYSAGYDGLVRRSELPYDRLPPSQPVLNSNGL